MYVQLQRSLPLIGRYIHKVLTETDSKLISDKTNIMILKFKNVSLKISYLLSSKNNETYYQFFITLMTNDKIPSILFKMETLVLISNGLPNAGDQMKLVGALSEIINRSNKKD